ncbi:putative divalent cation tolerance protein [Actinacidiphila reveromycinica]|uniref:Putative divalent cation tolerance protein n=1 Tax=Actinacidiphila reveromycinica TaxID=659352 RepID=A0A7U3UWZ9_9ACTN|nr:divalent-cation tolerance protein CutA [Streptomyces sp. SN-593]BBB00302.1 putative divalent cation tolerance protein [Streptomyces sp. SN-593]
MSGYLAVLTTTDSAERAEQLARAAVEARAAACAQIDGPIRSVYRWEGAVQAEQEWRVLLKTTAERYDALEAVLTAAHTYDTPEIIAVPIERGGTPYLAWLDAETAAG